MTLEIAHLIQAGTTTGTVISVGPRSDLARRARLHIGLEKAVEMEEMVRVEVTLDALAEPIQATMLRSPKAVHRLPSQYGIAPCSSGSLTLKPKMCPKTLLNLIKVLRISAWLRRLHVCT